MNTIILEGHLGADPETRVTPQGRKVTNFRIAVNVWQSGEEVTIWYRVAVWGDNYEKILTHLKKGSAVIVNGNLRKPTIWTDANGNNHVQLEVDAHHIQFPRIGKGQQNGEAYSQPQTQPERKREAYVPGPSTQGEAPEMASHHAAEDDLPF